MSDFEKKKKEILTPLLVEAGASLMDCQNFEYGIALFLYYLSHTGIDGLDPKKMANIMDDVEKKTAGQLLHLLKKHVSMSEEKETALKDALASRNKIIHRMLIDNIERFILNEDRDGLLKDIRNARRIVNKGSEILQPINLELGKSIGGVDSALLNDEISKIIIDDYNQNNKK